METLYRKDGAQWVPTEYTLGPLPGAQHGGAVAGVTVNLLEAHAKEIGAGSAMMVSICQLRPAPIAPATIEVETVRQGRRSAFLRAETYFDGKLTAIANAVYSHPLPVETLPPFREQRQDPSESEPFSIEGMAPGPHFGHALEIRVGAEGMVWMRPTRPVVDEITPVARVCGMADMSPGCSMIATRTDWRNLVAAFPTTDLTVHLARPPRGEWLGVRAKTQWYDNGLGMTESAIFDEAGPLGRIAQSLVAIPHPA